MDRPSEPGDAGELPNGEVPGGAGEVPGGAGADPAGAAGLGGAADDALRRLEQRLDRASEAAERLLAEAAGTAARAARAAADAAAGAAGTAAAAGQADPAPAGAPGVAEPPPAGWQSPSSDTEQASRGDLELLAHLIQPLRDLIPAELQRRLAEALRELLLALRALIDWYLERSERRPSKHADVQDIPIL